MDAGKRKKIAITIISSLSILVAATLAFVLLWEGEPRELKTEANKFNPPSSWKLESEHIEPKRITCIGDNVCPSLSRHWIVSNHIKYSEVSSLLRSANWTDITENTCADMDAKVDNDNFSCSISLKTPEYNVQFYLSQATDRHDLIEASLFAKP